MPTDYESEFSFLGMHFIPLTTISSSFCGFSTDQFRASHRFHRHGLLQQPIEQQNAGTGSSAIKAESELIQIVIYVRGAHGSLVGPHQPTLEQGSHLIDSWQQIISQLNGRANHPVIVAQSLQTAVTPPIISLNSSPRLNGFTHRWLQAGSGSIINSCEANSANLSSISLSSDQNQCFASSPTPSLARVWCPDEGLIDFNGPSQTISTRPHHCSPQLMQPGPSRAVAAQAQHPLHAQCTRTRFLIGDIPDSLEPNSQRF